MMNVNQLQQAKEVMHRWISSYRCRTFIGFKGSVVKPYGFRSYYWAHTYTARDYLLGIKEPHGACLSLLGLKRSGQ